MGPSCSPGDAHAGAAIVYSLAVENGMARFHREEKGREREEKESVSVSVGVSRKKTPFFSFT